jgi:hypothetical protein
MLDVIITSSCRKTIVAALDSFLDKVHCSDKLRFLVHIDVLKPKNLSHIKNYLRRLEVHSGFEVKLRINSNPDNNWYTAHTKAVNYLFNKIETPYYFHLEDDWIFIKYVDLDPLIKLMNANKYIDHIRFSKEIIKEKAWLYHLSDEISEEYLVPNVEVVIDGIPLVRTPLWSFNPHLGRSSVIKNFINIPPNNNPEKYVCHKYLEIVKEGHTYIYGRIGDSAFVKDLGRNIIKQKIRKIKYILSGGKYANYRFGP